MELKTATPVEIDTRLAELHTIIRGTASRLTTIVNRVLDHSGLRTYVSATWTSKARYEITGTFQEGLELLRKHKADMEAWVASDYDKALFPKKLSNYAGDIDPDDAAREHDALKADLYGLWTKANELEAEYQRRPWSRYFLVVSSPGHIHSSTRCQTCRITTAFGWMPEKSGQSQAEAIAGMGPYAESLCSVCFPDAPVAGKMKLTAAKARKLSAGEFAVENQK